MSAKKIGPLPAWGWIVVGVGALWMLKRQKQSVTTKGRKTKEGILGGW